jgi:hypothetical protein
MQDSQRFGAQLQTLRLLEGKMNRDRMRSLARIRFESLMRTYIEPEDFERPDYELVRTVFERYEKDNKPSR